MLLLEGSHAFFMQILHDLDHRLILFRTRSWFRNSAWLFLLNCECTWSILKECTLRMHLFWYLQRSWTVDHWLLCNLRVCVCVLIIFNLIWNSFGIAAFPCWGDLQPAGQLLLVQGAPPLPQAHRTGSVAVTRLFQNAVTMPLGWRMKTTLTTSCQFLTEGPHATRAYEANHIEDWKINLHITCPFSIQGWDQHPPDQGNSLIVQKRLNFKSKKSSASPSWRAIAVRHFQWEVSEMTWDQFWFYKAMVTLALSETVASIWRLSKSQWTSGAFLTPPDWKRICKKMDTT